VRVAHEGGGFLVKTNSTGFRCENEVAESKPVGRYRILLFGDSFTAGYGVSNQFRFGDRIEGEFQELEILNFGLDGTGTDEQYLIFKEFAAGLDYDLLLICPWVENIRRVASRYGRIGVSTGEFKLRAKPYFELDGGTLRLHNVPVPKGLIDEQDLPLAERAHVYSDGPLPGVRRLVNRHLGRLKPRLQRWTRYQALGMYASSSNPGWALMRAILSRWIEDVGGRPVILCPLPQASHIDATASPDAYRRRFQELASRQTYVHDPLPRFWQESPQNRLRCRFQRDFHLNSYGHEVLAASLLPPIRRISGLSS